MPMLISESQGATQYQEPFIGRLDHTLTVKVDVSALTTDHVDTKGRIKPGLSFTRAGLLAGLSALAAAVPASNNTGNGTVGALLGKAGKPSEVFTLKAISSTVFSVIGSRSGRLANATVGTPYTSAGLNFTITAGGTAFVAGDEFQIVATEGGAVFGTVPEATQIVPENPTNESLAANTTDAFVAVGVLGIVDRDAVEKNLGRVLNDSEVAAFLAGACKLVLSRI